jgi:peptidoglycan glycosyltransferase
VRPMERQIARLGMALLLLFGVLFLQMNRLQVLDSSQLADSPSNHNATIKLFSTDRGPILTADGGLIAYSRPTSDPYHYQRVYPNGPLYADVSGYFSLIYGESGLEAAYNKYLEAHPAPVRNLNDLLNPQSQADEVVTTLSSQLQQVAAKALGSLKGAVVALDPSTGAVLAMYSSPSFDPNPLASQSAATEEAAWAKYTSDPAQPLLARAYRRSYAPGSTFKIVTSTAVYDQDPALATHNYPPVSSISLPDTSHRLHNYGYETCGGQMPELFKVSCDTGYSEIGLSLGPNRLAAEAARFGFNQVPPFDLPAVASTFPPPSTFARDPAAVAFSAIGQFDVSATALQMALVTAAIANGGKMMTPHVMAQIRSPNGQVVTSYQPSVWLRPTSAATASQVTQLMVGVVQGGTASNVALPGVQVAAKTGTAQTVGHSLDNAWLAAFAPASHPTIAVAVVVPAQPGLGNNPTGSADAGPIARAVLASALGVSGG